MRGEAQNDEDGLAGSSNLSAFLTAPANLYTGVSLDIATRVNTDSNR
jgi:hypothetical protein